MMLPFVYVMFAAKPVSIRRLCVLFVLLVAAAAAVLSLTHARHVSTTALQTASTVTVAAWAYPLIRILLAIRRRGAFRQILGEVSLPVQASYGLSVLLVPTLFAAGLWARLHGKGLYLGEFSEVATVVCVVVPLLLVVARVMSIRPQS